jgi:signal peptidase II
LKRVLRNWGWLPLIAAAVVIVDQLTKGWVEDNIPVGGQWVPFPALEPYFKLVHFTNTGAAFGLLRGQGGLFAMIALVVIVVVLIYSRYLPTDSWGVRLCLALALGGAAGNLIDRIELGQVTDFVLLSLPLRDRVLDWPAFNVADSSIVVGVIVLALLLMRSETAQVETAPATGPVPVAEPVAEPADES